jgi:hypothetical protein
VDGKASWLISKSIVMTASPPSIPKPLKTFPIVNEMHNNAGKKRVAVNECQNRKTFHQ